MQDEGARTQFVYSCAALVAAGFVARLVLAWYSIGTNDAGAWRKFAAGVDAHGLIDAYARFPSLNHPPLPALWAAGALRVSRASGLSFEFVFKLPAILADVGSCLVLARIWSARRGGARSGWIAALLMAWNPAAILVGACHCNTDNVYAFLCLLACYFADRRNLFAAGAALAAAINVKLIPVLLVLPLLSLCRDRRDVWQFLNGLHVGIYPFIPILIGAAEPFARNALGYNPQANRWGVGFALYELYLHEPTRRLALDAMRFYFDTGRWFILAAVALLSFFSWRRRAWDAYQLGALALSIFLTLTPGFGLQYAVIAAPLLLAASLRWGAAYGLIAGVFIFTAYATVWTGTVPFYSFFDGPFSRAAALTGAITWAILVVYSLRTLARGNRSPTLSGHGPDVIPASRS